MCLGCLFAFFAAAFPRLGFLIVWAFTNWVEVAFRGSWFVPLMGLIFTPFTALMYVLVSLPTGAVNLGGWLLIGLAFLADLAHWAQLFANRNNAMALYNQYRSTGLPA